MHTKRSFVFVLSIFIMQIKKIFFLLSIITLASGCASVPNKQTKELSPFSAQGWGGTTCHEMLNDIDPNNSNKDVAGLNIGLYQSWISGFISGTNYAQTSVYDVSGASTPEESFTWIKNYCLDHPQTPIPLALHELILAWESEGIILTEPTQ